MKYLVAGIDTMPEDEPVLECIERLAEESPVRVLLVHVVSRAALWIAAGMQCDTDAYLRDASSDLERHAAARLRTRGIATTTLIRRGDPANQLARLARRVNADRIIVGGPHHRALHDVVHGSVTHRLEHLATAPVLVVPRGTRPAPEPADERPTIPARPTPAARSHTVVAPTG